MSMQRIRNYGSTLQAYGLRELIRTVTPSAKVGFIDFRPGKTLVDAHVVPNRTLTRTWSKLRDYGQIDAPIADRMRFINHKRRYAASYLSAAGIKTATNYDTAVDVQVIGSDEVFNCVQSNSNVGYSRDLFGHGSSARTLMSYAASFGNTTLDKLQSHRIADQVAEDLARFALLSVRDRHSQSLVRTLTGREAFIHVDPVLAYDYMECEPRIPSQRLEPSEYLIVYAYPGRLQASENDAIRSYARRRGLRILALGGPQTCADRFVDCDPFELLAYFRDASAVVTDTFHGTIFALINHRRFATIIRRSVGAGYGNEEKLGHLLATFASEGRSVSEATGLDACLDQEVERDPLEAVLARERTSSRRFLQAAFDSLDDSP